MDAGARQLRDAEPNRPAERRKTLPSPLSYDGRKGEPLFRNAREPRWLPLRRHSSDADGHPEGERDMQYKRWIDDHGPGGDNGCPRDTDTRVRHNERARREARRRQGPAACPRCSLRVNEVPVDTVVSRLSPDGGQAIDSAVQAPRRREAHYGEMNSSTWQDPVERSRIRPENPFPLRFAFPLGNFPAGLSRGPGSADPLVTSSHVRSP